MAAVKKLYFAMDKISAALGKVFIAASSFLVVACCAILIFQVFNRFILIHFVALSLPFPEELARILLIWSVYLCLGVCLKEGAQASVTLVYDRLSPKPKFALYCVVRLMMLFFLVIAIVYGLEFVQDTWNYKTANLRAPGWMLYTAPVLGCVLMLYEMITEWLGVWCGELEPFSGC